MKEYFEVFDASHAPRERVSWNWWGLYLVHCLTVTLHVSVWVEILMSYTIIISIVSRSTWACELKLWRNWVCLRMISSRSTWACELKYVGEEEDKTEYASRSTWACELKSLRDSTSLAWICHAPRERVSWNWFLVGIERPRMVTLHVSVWVEIPAFVALDYCVIVTLHVSVWVEIY